MGNNNGVKAVPGVMMYRFNSPLTYFNVAYFKRRILNLVDGTPFQPRWVVVDAVASFTHADISVLAAIDELKRDLLQRNVKLVLARRRTELTRWFRINRLGRDKELILVPDLYLALKLIQSKEQAEATVVIKRGAPKRALWFCCVGVSRAAACTGGTGRSAAGQTRVAQRGQHHAGDVRRQHRQMAHQNSTSSLAASHSIIAGTITRALPKANLLLSERSEHAFLVDGGDHRRQREGDRHEHARHHKQRQAELDQQGADKQQQQQTRQIGRRGTERAQGAGAFPLRHQTDQRQHPADQQHVADQRGEGGGRRHFQQHHLLFRRHLLDHFLNAHTGRRSEIAGGGSERRQLFGIGAEGLIQQYGDKRRQQRQHQDAGQLVA